MKTKKFVSWIAVFAMLIGVMSSMPAETNAAVKTIYVTKGESVSISVKNATKKTKWSSKSKAVTKNTAMKNAVKVTGKKRGSTTLKAKIGKKQVQYKIVVETPKISKSNVSLTVGKTANVKMTGTKRSFKWKSDNNMVAAVSSSGKITAKKKGSANISATIGNKKYTCEVTVKMSEKQEPANTQKPGTPEQKPEEETKDVINRPTDELREVMVPNGDCKVYSRMYLPAATKKCPAIIMLHGYNGSADDFIDECEYYQKKGVIAVSIDACGGTWAGRCRSTGRASTEMTIFTQMSDMVAVFDYVRNMEEVDENNVFLFGGSQGGLVAAMAAEERADQVRGLGLYFPAFGIPDQWRGATTTPFGDPIGETFDFWGLMLGKNFVDSMQDFYTFEVLGKKYQGPVHIVHGDADDVAPLSLSQKAISENYENATLRVLKGAGHGYERGSNYAKTAMMEIYKFMKNKIQ